MMSAEIRAIKEKYNYDFSILLEYIENNEEDKVDNELKNIADFLYNKLRRKRKIDEWERRKKCRPIFAFAECIDIDVRIGQINEGIKGYISIDGDNRNTFDSDKVIVINSKIKSEYVQKIIVLHEIAYYIFDFNETNEYHYAHIYHFSDDEENNNPKEILANKFVRAILLPKEEFTYYHDRISKQEHMTYYDLVKSLCEHFCVPADLVDKRIKELQL